MISAKKMQYYYSVSSKKGIRIHFVCIRGSLGGGRAQEVHNILEMIPILHRVDICISSKVKNVNIFLGCKLVGSSMIVIRDGRSGWLRS